MMGSLAEFEQAMIRAGTRWGSRERKSRGLVLAVGGWRIAMLPRFLPSRGRGVRRIAKDLKTGVGTVLRIKNELVA